MNIEVGHFYRTNVVLYLRPTGGRRDIRVEKGTIVFVVSLPQSENALNNCHLILSENSKLYKVYLKGIKQENWFEEIVDV